MSIAEKHNKSLHQVILRWLLQIIILIIPKSVKYDRLQANADIFTLELTDQEMQEIKKLDTGRSCLLDRDHPDTIRAMSQHRYN